MTFVLVVAWGIAAGMAIVLLSDGLGRRKDRESQQHPRG